MRKRRLQAPPNDSLELLLDTLCNVFGGIILIACLLATISRPKPKEEPAPREDEKQRGILITEQIQKAQAELDGLQTRRSALQREDEDQVTSLIAELRALEKTALEKRQEKAHQDELAAKKAKEKIQDSGSELARLRKQVQEVENKLGTLDRATEAARQRHAALRKELSDLQMELETVENLRTEELRLPREHASEKIAAPIIVRFGQIFPLYDAQLKPSPNVRHIPTPDGNITAIPQQGIGLDVRRDAARLRAFLPILIGEQRYLTLYVYPDSYPAFRELKKIIIELGLDYGLEICDEHRVLIFNANGLKPAPL